MLAGSTSIAIREPRVTSSRAAVDPSRLLVAGNWKMNGTRAQAREWSGAALAVAGASPAVEVALFPPAIWLTTVADVLGSPGGIVSLGGQHCHAEREGAHTAGISSAMLLEAGCRYALAGHSEVRGELGLSDAAVRAVVDAALAVGLRPLVCVGETAAERADHRTREVLVRQVDAVFAGRHGAGPAADVAYEPVWAIGTGLNPSSEQAREAHVWIRERLDDAGARRSRILYGGSVTPANIGGFLSQPGPLRGFDGVLAGGSSLSIPSFRALVESASAAAALRRRP
jgi:triosephosphate isomerase